MKSRGNIRESSARRNRLRAAGQVAGRRRIRGLGGPQAEVGRLRQENHPTSAASMSTGGKAPAFTACQP
jgi:hypothetical protein